MTLKAGVSKRDISPQKPMFLLGYPHVPRISTGTHDPLFASALYMHDGSNGILLVAVDVLMLSSDTVHQCRVHIGQATGLPAENILISTTHTHSAPVTIELLAFRSDPVVPPVDPEYLEFVCQGMIGAATEAYSQAVPASAAVTTANARGVGGNRHHLDGPSDPEVGVLYVREKETRNPIALNMVYSMHPTVLHEDNKLVSGDFPAMCRQYLQQAEILGPDCPVLYHTGPEGNQSPRHVVNGQTFEEAQRLGSLLGQAVQAVLPTIQFSSDISLSAQQGFVELPRKTFPDVEQAEANLKAVVEKLARQRSDGTDRATVRTTECDWFGAEEVVVLAKAQQEGRLDVVASTVMPAEIQIISVGQWKFVGWPGEIFIEYALALKAKSPNTFIANLANGDLQGYLVTAEAAAEGGYEASNAMFSHESGQILVDKTLDMIKTLQD